VKKRLLLFAATTGYQIRVFADAARRLGVDLTLATDRCHVMEDPWGDRAVAVKFDRVAESLAGLRGMQFDGVAAVGDRPAVLAAEAAEMLGLPFHPAASTRACHDKNLARQSYEAAGMKVPWYFRAVSEGDAARAQYPCVLKPLRSTASRGVIRADDAAQFASAFRRIARMGEHDVQVEGYIDGREYALEGLVTGGELRILAIFDKPDPLTGPYFDETIYVTPSREPAEVQSALAETAAQAVKALGLTHGPVHIEVRGRQILETAARPIGGLCGKALRFAGGVPLEELVLRHALGEDVSGLQREVAASGVMMVPIPRGGVFESVDGVESAAAIPAIEDVIITAQRGEHLIPLPEGSSYLGFIFARAETPGEVEEALRRSHAELTFHVATALETISPSL
jgi:biotin carboxylase